MTVPNRTDPNSSAEVLNVVTSTYKKETSVMIAPNEAVTA